VRPETKRNGGAYVVSHLNIDASAQPDSIEVDYLIVERGKIWERKDGAQPAP